MDMNIQEILFLTLLFLAVFIFLWLLLFKFSGDPIRNRVARLADLESIKSENSEFVSNLVKIIDPMSKLSLPSEGWEKSPLHIRFVNAGWRSPEAPKLYFGIKTLLTVTFTVLAYIFLDKSLQADNPSVMVFILIIAAAIGYYLPNFVLSAVLKNRKQEIVGNLPDATDLLIVCIEAGLSFDQALSKVASEIKVKSKILGEEFDLVLMELRTGFTRDHTLKNLSLRTGVEEIDLLATMVNQSERFGTSIADSLRVYADTARTKRRQKAEETAAKIATKLMFPLLMCMLPAIFVVLLVPALMQIKEFFS